MSEAAPSRQPHATLDLPSRHWKGMKIERLLNLSSRPQPVRMLEIGTGSGGIAYYFAMHPHLRCEVTAVDVVDNRQVIEGYAYQKVQGVELPFPDAWFDVVITNHVIEHVGNADAQTRHLAEIHRVMEPDGVGYLAVPNRWMFVEPHYKLAFLSWLPHAWRTPYLRASGKGCVYDCEPLQMQQLENLLTDTGFQYHNLCVEALRAVFEIERPKSVVARVLQRLPDSIFVPMRRIIPTLIYEFRRTR